MKVLVDTFNQEKALEGAFSVIVKTDGSFAALIRNNNQASQCCCLDVCWPDNCNFSGCNMVKCNME